MQTTSNFVSLGDYHWEALFKFAAPSFVAADRPGNPPADPFSEADIATVEVSFYDFTDEREGEFYALVRLKSGTWAALQSWHDYTGWD